MYNFCMSDIRKTIVVCGVWEDAENLNVFVRSLQTKEVIKDYVIACFTFGIPTSLDTTLEMELQFAENVNKADPAALVIFAEMLKNDELIECLVDIGIKKNIPVFMCEHEHKGCYNLTLNYAKAFEEMTKHVICDHNCKVIDMMAGFKDNPFSEERIRACRKVAESEGVNLRNIYYGDFWDVPAKNVMDALIKDGYELPDAIICANDSMAIGTCDSLHNHGYVVPRDVIVTGFDGIWQGRYHNPTISTTAPDYSSMIPTMLDIIRNYNPGEAADGYTINIDFKREPAQSCGCVLNDDESWANKVITLASDNHDYFRHNLEMGRFVTRTFSMSDIDTAAQDLQNYLWLWKEQYYFIAVQESSNCIHCVFYGRNGEYKYRQRFYDMPGILPDLEDILARDSGINILLLRQIRSKSEAYGYVVNGYKKINLRDQQRFEEFGLFLSAMTVAVMNNRKYIQANRSIEKISESDYLTGLYNRRGFFRRLNAMIVDPAYKGKFLTFFSIDMDGLKAINDKYGHREGDLAIHTLANSIRRYASENGLCARYGGDEFAFALVEDDPSSVDTSGIRTIIESYAANDILTADKPYTIRASIGVATHIIDDTLVLEDIINESDEAMYKDKQSRRSR